MRCIGQLLRMIRFFSQHCVEESLARGPLASAVRLDGDEDCVDFCELLRVVTAQGLADGSGS
jgi:hypothetical protein